MKITSTKNEKIEVFTIGNFVEYVRDGENESFVVMVIKDEKPLEGCFKGVVIVEDNLGKVQDWSVGDTSMFDKEGFVQYRGKITIEV